MRLPVSFVGLGSGALDQVSVRARRRIAIADLVIADRAYRIAPWVEQAEVLDAALLSTSEVVGRLREAFEAGRWAVRVIEGEAAESVRALEEMQALWAARVLVEVVPFGLGRERLPLAGRRVAVTHVRGEPDTFSELLARLGATVLEAPTHELAPPEDGHPLDEAIEELANYEIAVFTSAAGAQRFVARLLERGKDLRALAGTRIAAVGTGTAQTLRSLGLRADVVPTEHRGEALAEALKRELAPGARVLIARAQEGREVLPQELTRAGMTVDVVPVYRSIAVPGARLLLLKTKLAAGEVDAVAFASAAAARALVSALGGVELLAHASVACLGPVTAEGCEALGLRVAVQAPHATYPELVEALCQHFAERRLAGSS